MAGERNGYETRPSADRLLTECLQPRRGIKEALSAGWQWFGRHPGKETTGAHPIQQVQVEALESSLGMHNALP